MESVHASTMCLFFLFQIFITTCLSILCCKWGAGKGVRMCHGICVEVRRQLTEISSLLLPSGPQGLKAQVVRLGSSCLHPLNHLHGPYKGLCHHLVVNQYLTVYSGWWYLTRVPAFERESQENQKLKTSLGSYLKKIKNKTKFQFVVAFLYVLAKMKQNVKDINRHFPQN